MGQTHQTRSAPLQTTPIAKFWEVYGANRTRIDHTGESYSYFPWAQETDSFRTRDPETGLSLSSETDESLSGEEIRSNLRRNRTNPSFDTGHDFYTRKTEIAHSHISANLQRLYPGFPNDSNNYQGHLIVQVTSNGYCDTPPPGLSTLYSAGRRAISKTIPTAPEANLATMLGELRHKLPDLMGLQTYNKGLGGATASEHLNYQFGVKPLISDLQKLAQGVLNASKQARQMQRNSGANVRRKMLLQDDSRYSDVTNAAAFLGMSRRNGENVTYNIFVDGNHPPVKSFDVIRQKTWFSGAFTYHLSQAHSFLGKLDKYEALANKLLGSRITPEVIWELTPWSWLIDWFSDAGVFMTNVSAFSNDSLVLRYGYVMSQTTSTRTHTISGLRPLGGYGSCPGSVTAFYTDTVKRRVKATPYGFGVDLGTLNPKQWSILAALGMTLGGAPSLRSI